MAKTSPIKSYTLPVKSGQASAQPQQSGTVDQAVVDASVELALAPLKTDLAALKASGVAASQAEMDAVADRIQMLESRKQVTDNIIATVIYDGKALPTVTEGRPQASGFNGDGTGDVAGATSWNAGQVVVVPVNQTGTDKDTFIVSVGVNPGASYFQISIRANGITARYSKANGLEPNGMSGLSQFNDGTTCGMTLRVKQAISANVDFVGFNYSQAYYMVVKKETLAGLKANGTALVDTVMLDSKLAGAQANVDLTGYALKSDIPAAQDLSPYAKTAYVDSKISDIPAPVNYSTSIAAKANQTDLAALQTTVSNKADKTQVSSDLALKADKTSADATATGLSSLLSTVTNNKTAQDAIKVTADAAAKATDLAATNVRITAIEAVPTATGAEVTARNTNVRRWTPNMVVTAVETVNSNQKTIGEWQATVTYAKDAVCMRNKAFFVSNIAGNLNKDPATDSSGAWGPFVPGETGSLFFNRQPTNSDVYPPATKWYDTSFGADSPLLSISLGNGAWAFLNEIKLAKVRLFCNGQKNTYRSSINNVKFFKPDGTQIPNSWFVWGSSSGISGGAVGVAYAGQQVYCGYNASGWVDVECSSQFDTGITVGKLTGDYPSDGTLVQCSRVEFWYTNGSRKAFSGTGYQANAGAAACNCDPVVICRYGDAVSAAQGAMLSAAELSDPTNTKYGRISPAALNSALKALVSPTAKTPSQADFDLLLNRVAQLEARLP